MAIGPLNSVSGFSVGDNPKQDVIYANGDVAAFNFTATGVSNLGPVSNVVITGGTSGYLLTTDGAGNLSWTPGGNTTSIDAAYMPYIINTGEIYLVPANRQGLFSIPIDIGDGTLEVDGILVEV